MEQIDRIRRFNRFYTKQLGLFTRNFGDTGLSVTELRVLYEIAEGDVNTARSLAQDLELDEGYVSRILKEYEKDGWIDRKPAKTDARRKTLKLTEKGRGCYTQLVQKTRAETMRRLDGAQQAEVADALWNAMRAFGQNLESEITIRDMMPGDAGWVVQRHAETYADELGFDWQMEALVMVIMSEFLGKEGVDGNRAFIAEEHGRRLGSIFCMSTDDPHLAKLRLFFVEPSARGKALGKRLLTACLDHARAAGFRRMTLMTHDTQDTARALYARYGFHLEHSAAGRHFGQDCLQETWTITF